MGVHGMDLLLVLWWSNVMRGAPEREAPSVALVGTAEVEDAAKVYLNSLPHPREHVGE
jgi:hypothetical protein